MRVCQLFFGGQDKKLSVCCPPQTMFSAIQCSKHSAASCRARRHWNLPRRLWPSSSTALPVAIVEHRRVRFRWVPLRRLLSSTAALSAIAKYHRVCSHCWVLPCPLMSSNTAAAVAAPHKSQKWIYEIKLLKIVKVIISNCCFMLSQVHLFDLVVI